MATIQVMGLDKPTFFSDKVPPSFDGHSNYEAYREYFCLWLSFTTLEATRQGSMIIARLAGEAKASAKSLGFDTITSSTGTKQSVEKRDKRYKEDATTQLDQDLARFLDYRWSSKESIAGFYTRLYKITSLNLDDKLKGHLLLRHTDFDKNIRNMVIGAASRKYDVKHITRAIRIVFHSSYRNDTAPGYYQGFLVSRIVEEETAQEEGVVGLRETVHSFNLNLQQENLTTNHLQILSRLDQGLSYRIY